MAQNGGGSGRGGGRGAGGGKGQGRGNGQGGGKGKRGGFAMGAEGVCVCLKCGKEAPHTRGIPCSEIKCPGCGAPMTRKGAGV